MDKRLHHHRLVCARPELLIEQARDPSSRQDLIPFLRTLTQRGSSAEAAALLTRLLDSRALDGLEHGGSSLRAVAVEALLELGFPHALEVRPEDLEFLRATQAKPWIQRAIAVGVGATGLWGGALAVIATRPPLSSLFFEVLAAPLALLPAALLVWGVQSRKRRPL